MNFQVWRLWTIYNIDMLNHPYLEFENTSVWTILEKAINELEGNKDLKLTTPKEYVIGYVCKQLTEADVLNTSAAQTHRL